MPAACADLVPSVVEPTDDDFQQPSDKNYSADNSTDIEKVIMKEGSGDTFPVDWDTVCIRYVGRYYVGKNNSSNSIDTKIQFDHHATEHIIKEDEKQDRIKHKKQSRLEQRKERHEERVRRRRDQKVEVDSEEEEKGYREAKKLDMRKYKEEMMRYGDQYFGNIDCPESSEDDEAVTKWVPEPEKTEEEIARMEKEQAAKDAAERKKRHAELDLANKPFQITFGRNVFYGKRIPRGVAEAIRSMRKGEKAILTISPEHGYGEEGSAGLKEGESKYLEREVPPNVTLEYEIELVDFFPAKKEVWEMSEAEILDKCKGYKESAGEFLGSQEWQKAVEQYIKGLEILMQRGHKGEIGTLSISLLLNKSHAHMKLKEWGLARQCLCQVRTMREDNENICTDDQVCKVRFRLTTCLIEMCEWDESKKELSKWQEALNTLATTENDNTTAAVATGNLTRKTTEEKLIKTQQNLLITKKKTQKANEMGCFKAAFSKSVYTEKLAARDMRKMPKVMFQFERGVADKETTTMAALMSKGKGKGRPCLQETLTDKELIEGQSGRVTFTLYEDLLPETVGLIKKLCGDGIKVGESSDGMKIGKSSDGMKIGESAFGDVSTGTVVQYQGSAVERVFPGYMMMLEPLKDKLKSIRGGAIKDSVSLFESGTCGLRTFIDEHTKNAGKDKHDKGYLLCLKKVVDENSLKQADGFSFSITLFSEKTFEEAAQQGGAEMKGVGKGGNATAAGLDMTQIVVGEVTEGHHVIDAMANMEGLDINGRPIGGIKIKNCSIV